MLPSEVEARATAFDLMVLDVHTTWENYQRNPDKLASAKTEDLEMILEKTRSGT